VPAHGASHDDFAKVVCLTRITTKELDDSGSEAEINIGLSSSNFGSKLETFWPKKASDCPVGSTYHEGWDERTKSCSVPTNGGGLNVNDLCTSMYDKNYVLGLRFREIDGGDSSDDMSMTSIKAKDLLPKMSSEGKLLTDQALSIFVQEEESAIKSERKVTVEPSISAKAGVSLDLDDNLSANADLKLGAKFP
jgi:hypothetical protein